MKQLMTFLSLFIAYFASSQIYTPVTPTVYGNHVLREKADSAQHIPKKSTDRLSTNDNSAQIFTRDGFLILYVDGTYHVLADTTYSTGGTGGISQSQLDDTASAIRNDFPTFSGITQSQLDDTATAIRNDFPPQVDFNSFQAESDQTLYGIDGPVTGSTTFTPILSGDNILEGKFVYLLIRNNIPEIRGTDYESNQSTGTITFSQAVNYDENFQVFYRNTTTSSIGSGDTSHIVIDTSTFATKFGVLMASNDLSTSQKISLSDSFGVDYIRTGIELSTYDGTIQYLDNLLALGGTKKAILNVNWKNVSKDADGNRIPNPFVLSGQYSLYNSLLNSLLTKYKTVIEFVVIENEPFNAIYYDFATTPISDYIALLGQAITTCHAQSVLVADGGIAISSMPAIIAGGTLNAKDQRSKDIINAYPSLDLDYTNVHTHAINQPTYDVDLETIANYIRAHNGSKPVVCNEFYIAGSYTSLIESVVSKMKLSNMIYSVVYDAGDVTTQPALPLHTPSTLNLNDIGIAFKNAIIP